MAIAISMNDRQTAGAFWTLLKPQKREVRQLLAARLEDSLCEEETSSEKAISLAEAHAFVRTLSVRGERKVSVDEKGIHALLDEKYKISPWRS